MNLVEAHEQASMPGLQVENPSCGGATTDTTLNGGGACKYTSGVAPNRFGDGLAAADGGIFTYGNASFNGSTGGNPPATPVVAVGHHLTLRGSRLAPPDTAGVAVAVGTT